MIIVLWLATLILFTIALTIVMRLILKDPNKREILKTLGEGIKEGLKGCGFILKKDQFIVEFYKWVTMGDENVCDDCSERAHWEAMDIADWMKEGLPRTPECNTECGENCRCELILYKSRVSTKKPK